MKLDKISFNAPLSVELLITQKCNFNCKHCIFGCDIKKKKEMSKEDILKIIELLSKMKVFTIGLNGGEPLLKEKELYEIITLIKEKKMEFIITTNGSLLNKKFIDFIAKMNIACIRISFEYPDKEKYESFVGKKNSFDKLIKNIKYCIKKKVITVLLFPFYKENFKYFNDVVEFADKLGVTAVNAFPIIPFGRAEKIKNKLLTQNEYKDFLRFIVEKRKKTGTTILLGDFPLEFLVNKKLLHGTENLLGKVCPAGILTCVINWDGDVYPCPFFPISQGNIFREDLSKIWKKNKFLNQLRTIKRFKNTECETCKYLYICRGGCPARTFFQYHTINKKDPVCWYNEK